jgi:hypothetical protein
MSFVFLREDPNTHKEVYLMHVTETGRRISTKDPLDAMRFDTARSAYEFGRLLDIDWWKVGKR